MKNAHIFAQEAIKNVTIFQDAETKQYSVYIFLENGLTLRVAGEGDISAYKKGGVEGRLEIAEGVNCSF